jgi:spermidine/putrescine-binding protein
MAFHDERVERLICEARERRYGRRQLIARGAALGLAAPAIAGALRAVPAAAQDATPVMGADGTVQVTILDRAMTMDEIRAEIEREAEVNVGNWTYTANDTLIAKFVEHVQNVYGVGITLNYEASQAPSTYITNLYTALQSNNPPSYDVMAIEENYWAEAMGQPEPVAQEFLPSGLIPNADRVIPMLKREPTAVGFQASATPGIVYDRERAGWMTDWTDLADERLRGRLTMPRPGDITAGGFLLGICAALGGDYTNPEDMQAAIDFAVERVHPNVLQYTTDSAVLGELLSNGVVDAVGFWNSMARNEYFKGNTNTAFLIAESGQYLANGYMWIPKNAPHPVLAQIFVNWRLSDEAQFPPESWNLENGPWSELNEGLLGPSYEGLIPEWFAADYFDYYPTLDQLETNYKSVDWDYYAANVGGWMDAYSRGIGQ